MLQMHVSSVNMTWLTFGFNPTMTYTSKMVKPSLLWGDEIHN